jgi:hypothetical protein
VWTIRDEAGFPAPLSSSGERAQPFWSSRSRAERIIKTVQEYSGFVAVEISWQVFCEKWVPGLTQDGIKVGVNWSGTRAVGYDMDPERLKANVEAVIENPQ